ncbi:MAG: alpha,alpha-trehalase [Flavobacteriales bacterium]|jgi:alpha,alpha-trehalase
MGTSYRDLRAGAESGWDFSSRWFDDGMSLATISTTDILPVDLNSLLYFHELVLSRAYKLKGEMDSSDFYYRRSESRKKSMMIHFWSSETNFFHDYNFKKGHITESYSLASLYPLLFAMVEPQKARYVSETVREKFLERGGVVTTLVDTGEQWDYPNGWAPLQWVTIVGLHQYGFESLASDIKSKWVKVNVDTYKKTGKIMEKYNVVDVNTHGGGGEYPLQDGFGWTNGVLLWLLRADAEDYNLLH